jgi:hypothetical protein
MVAPAAPDQAEIVIDEGETGCNPFASACASA